MTARSGRVLVVDDNTLSRSVVTFGFSHRGWECLGAASAVAALDAIETFAPDAVVLEWVFRDGSGIGLARRLRSRSEELGRSLVVVVVSLANEPSGFREREDIDAYLTKPLDVAEIEHAIETARADRSKAH
jgi:DNA-binding response OmpR family regulator